MNKVKLVDVSELITKGTTPTTVGGKFTPKGIKFIKSESITDSKFLNKSLYEHISEETDEKLKRSRLKKNDLLFSIAGAYLGKIAIVRDCDLPSNTNQAVAIVRVNEKKADIDYLYYYFSQKHINQYINTLSSQSSQPNLNLELLGNLEYENIPIKEQKRISKILSLLDDKIENNNKINEELEAMAKTIYDYWFLQFEFPNEEGKPYKSSGGKMVWNEELKREIPEGWKCGTIGNLFSSQSGYAFKSSNWTENGYPVLTIKCINEDGTINMQESSYIKEYIDSFNKYSVKNGNMIFAMSGNTIGKLGIIASNINNILINQRILIIKTNINNMAYSYFTIKNDKIQNNIVQLGANSAQPNISEDLLRNIKICLPNTKYLDNYNNICKIIFEKIITNRIENEELTSIRDFLLPLLMNGQVGFKEVGLAL